MREFCFCEHHFNFELEAMYKYLASTLHGSHTFTTARPFEWTTRHRIEAFIELKNRKMLKGYERYDRNFGVNHLCILLQYLFNVNPQATKLLWRQRLPRRSGYHPLPSFRVWFKISYRVIHRLIQHIFLSKMVYLDVKYMTENRNYEFLSTGTLAH